MVTEELYTTTIIENIKLGSIIERHNGNKKESISSLFYYDTINVILPSVIVSPDSIDGNFLAIATICFP